MAGPIPLLASYISKYCHIYVFSAYLIYEISFSQQIYYVTDYLC